MSREEKRRKFNEAVVNMLFPPPPQPQDGDEPLNSLSKGFDAEPFSDELGLGEMGSSTTSDEDDDDDDGGNDSGSQKLTRAQRKRLRRKKLKEDASRRRKIIGPLSPPQNDVEDNSKVGGDNLENEPPTVRCYAAEEAFDKPGEPSSLGNQSKLKQRRMAKKLARKSLKMSSEEDCHRDQNLSSANEHQA